MESQYVYQKKRADFGRHPLFFDRMAEIQVDIDHNEDDRDDYMVRNPVHAGVQAVVQLSEHYANTDTFETSTKHINHVEGGWPKDINAADMEATSRFRKKTEKDENYSKTIVSLGERVEKVIRQNNAIDIYEEYFTDAGIIPTVDEPPRVSTVNLFRDPAGKGARSAINIAWHPDGGKHAAVSYGSVGFQTSPKDLESYVWNVENSKKPLITLRPRSSVLCMEYNPKDSNIILGGQFSGQVCIWDLRKNSPAPTDITAAEVSHRDPCHSALWIQSKTGTDFFSSSTDGTVKWWDTRKLSEPVEELILDPTKQLNPNAALGAICLEYEPTMPTKFMVGTEQGTIIICNRKGKTPADKIAALYQSYSGPVNTIARNPLYPKMFLTVGEWTNRIWSEDIRDSAIVTMKNSRYHTSAARWSPTRPAVFFTAKSDGSIDIWDLMVKQAQPTLNINVSDAPLCSMRVTDNGNLVAAGDRNGNVTLLSLNDALTELQKDEKSFCNFLFERETRREKVLEARNRELRLKEKQKNKPKVVEEESQEEPTDDPLTDIANELCTILVAEKKKHTLLERQFSFEIDQPVEDDEEEPQAE